MFGKCEVVGLYQTASIDSGLTARPARRSQPPRPDVIGQVMTFRSAAEAARLASERATRRIRLRWRSGRRERQRDTSPGRCRLPEGVASSRIMSYQLSGVRWPDLQAVEVRHHLAWSRRRTQTASGGDAAMGGDCLADIAMLGSSPSYSVPSPRIRSCRGLPTDHASEGRWRRCSACPPTPVCKAGG
jgi:hypothetical protein